MITKKLAEKDSMKEHKDRVISDFTTFQSYFIDDFIKEGTGHLLSDKLTSKYVIVPTRQRRFFNLNSDDEELLTVMLTNVDTRREVLEFFQNTDGLQKVVEEATGSMNSKIISLGSSIVTFDNLQKVIEKNVTSLRKDSSISAAIILYKIFKQWGITAYQSEVKIYKELEEYNVLQAIYSAADFLYIQDIVKHLPSKSSFRGDKIKVSSHAMVKTIYDEIFLFIQKLSVFISKSTLIMGSFKRMSDFVNRSQDIKSKDDVSMLYIESEDFNTMLTYLNLIEEVGRKADSFISTPNVRWKQEDAFTVRVLQSENRFFKVINITDCIKYLNIEVTPHMYDGKNRRITSMISYEYDVLPERAKTKFFSTFSFQGLQSINHVDMIPSIADTIDGLMKGSSSHLYRILSKESYHKDGILNIITIVDSKEENSFSIILEGAAASVAKDVYYDRSRRKIVYGLDLERMTDHIRPIFRNVINTSFTTDPKIAVISYVNNVSKTKDVYEGEIIDFEKYKLYSISRTYQDMFSIMRPFTFELDISTIGKKKVTVDISRDIMRLVKDISILRKSSITRKLIVFDDLLTIYEENTLSRKYEKEVIENFMSIALVDIFKPLFLTLKPLVRYVVFRAFENDNDSFNRLDNSYILSVMIPLYVDVFLAICDVDVVEFKSLNRDRFTNILLKSSYNLYDLIL